MIDSDRQDPHEILEVRPGCSAAELREAYERAKRQLGPDSLATYALVDPAEARAMLERIEHAYRSLCAVAGAPGASKSHGAKMETPPRAAEADVTDERKAEAELEKVEAPTVAPPIEAKAESPLAPAEPAAGPRSSAEAVPEEKGPDTKAGTTETDAPRPVRKAEAELAPDGQVTGEALRRVREAYGLTLKELAAKTKIGHWHLENIEKERYKDLPALVYLRGFLQSLARELKLDPIRVSRSYLEGMAKAQAEPKKQG